MKSPTRPKVLFMVHLPPPVHGAALRNESLVKSQLLNDHFNIRVHPLAFAKSIEDIGSVSLSKLLKAAVYAVRLLFHMVVFRPRIAYFTIAPVGGAFYRDVLFVFILKMFPTRIVYHLRGMGIKSAMTGGVKSALYRFVFRNTDVICLSRLQVPDVDLVKYHRLFIVPNGIKTESTRTAVHATSKNILFLSNYVESKGVYVFMEAIARLSSKRSDFTAQMIGANADVTLPDMERRRSQLKLDGVLKISGPAYKEQKFEALEGCFMFVFPTYYPNEVFPGVILEAMQCGKPVISTNHGVIADIIDDGKTGLIVPPKEVDPLVAAMNYLLDHPDSAINMGEQALQKFQQQYTLAHFENNMKDTLDNIITYDTK